MVMASAVPVLHQFSVSDLCDPVGKPRRRREDESQALDFHGGAVCQK